MEPNQCIAKIPVRNFYFSAIEARNMALPLRSTSFGDLLLREARVHKFLNYFYPVHTPIITEVFFKVNTNVFARNITIEL